MSIMGNGHATDAMCNLLHKVASIGPKTFLQIKVKLRPLTANTQQIRGVHLPDEGNLAKAATAATAVSHYLILYHICQPRKSYEGEAWQNSKCETSIILTDELPAWH